MSAEIRKKPRKKRRYSFLLLLGLVGFVIYLFVTGFANLSTVSEKSGALKDLKAEHQQIVEENNRLQSIVENDDKSEYLEQKGRELGYVMPGEKVFYDVTPGA